MNRSRFDDHRRDGSELVPPLADLNLTLSSWLHERIPEMLWAVLIIDSYGHELGLAEFRRILVFIGNHERREELYDLTLTGIANLEEGLRNELIGCIAEPTESSDALSPLLLFDSLPGREDWAKHLQLTEYEVEQLMRSVGAVISHQSQEATDCRWVRLMAQILGGKIHFPEKYANLREELRNYPYRYDQRKVRPTVRALEIGLDAEEIANRTWAESFWDEMWQKTPCFKIDKEYEPPSLKKIVTRQSISELREHLQSHWLLTHSTTPTDIRHGAVFGMAFYSLRIVEEMMGIGIGTSVLSRMGLRSITEVLLNLEFLLSEDSPELWEKWRDYGAGQAKLNRLKFADSSGLPEYIDIEELEVIANEHLQEELRRINLAGWSGLDLRRLSERIGLKEDVYDPYYSWTSGYSHGMWGAIRESCYQYCGNPLHRLHRLPDRSPLPDTINDAIELLERVIQCVDTAYPPFDHHFSTRGDKETRE